MARATATRQLQTILIAVITHASSHRLALQFALPSCQTEARPSWCQLCSCTSSLAQLTITCFWRQQLQLVWSPVYEIQWNRLLLMIILISPHVLPYVEAKQSNQEWSAISKNSKTVKKKSNAIFTLYCKVNKPQVAYDNKYSDRLIVAKWLQAYIFGDSWLARSIRG